jgi:hypothetical protein
MSAVKSKDRHAPARMGGQSRPSRVGQIKVWFDETFHSEEDRSPGVIYNRGMDDPDGIFNKTADVVDAVATLRKTTIVGVHFDLETVEGLRVKGYADVPAVLASGRIRPRVSFDYPAESPC